MRIEEEYQKLIDSIKETERSTQQTAERGWAQSRGMFDFYDGMACGYRYCLALLEIWRPRILGEEDE